MSSSRTGPNAGYIKAPKQSNPTSRNPETQDSVVANALISQAIDGADTSNWKDIKPARTYMDIKKKAFIDQKKRDFQQVRDAKNQTFAESKGLNYKGFDSKKQRVNNETAQ